MASMDRGDVPNINDWFFLSSQKVVSRLASIGKMLKNIIYVAKSKTSSQLIRGEGDC